MTNEPGDLILQAVARGWCHPKNEHKVMDTDLAIAIADEVRAELNSALSLLRCVQQRIEAIDCQPLATPPKPAGADTSTNERYIADAERKLAALKPAGAVRVDDAIHAAEQAWLRALQAYPDAYPKPHERSYYALEAARLARIAMQAAIAQPAPSDQEAGK